MSTNIIVHTDDVINFVPLAASTAVWSRNGQGASSPSYEPPLHSLVRDTDTKIHRDQTLFSLQEIIQASNLP